MAEIKNKILYIYILFFISSLSAEQHDSSMNIHKGDEKYANATNNSTQEFVDSVSKTVDNNETADINEKNDASKPTKIEIRFGDNNETADSNEKSDASKPTKIEIRFGDNNETADSNEKSDTSKPTEIEIRFGDNILKNVWLFIQNMINKLNAFEVLVEQKEYDYELVGFTVLDKLIEPSRNLIKTYLDLNCDMDLEKQIDDFLNYHKSSISFCRKQDNPKEIFRQINLSAMQYLDDLQIEITKEVSLCELMRPDKAQVCYNDAFRHAENEKIIFMNSYIYRIQREILDVSKEGESFWLDCTFKAVNEIDKANTILVKKLKHRKKNIHKKKPCKHLQKIFNSALRINPYTTDPGLYYLEKKHGGY
ncbi:uncharacterized protein LOC142327354 isoform X1 [Lycorma delicatula]|uniref:uncharacterized protein LOC142327354 isoform X1 n=1 Tax=Lycorma delicatula TaxID=130591 RepID=UPI003F50F558